MKLIPSHKRFLAGRLFIILLIASVTQSHAQNNGTFENSVITGNTLVASSFINDNEGWLADNGGILWHTSNAGQSWSSVFIEKYFTRLQFTDALNGFGITADAAYKTMDGGNTWSILSLPGSISNSLYFLDDNTGFITGNKTIYKTTNSGTTWTTILTNGASFTDYYFINASLGIATANDNDLYQSIWRTTDGGLNWTNVFDEPNYLMNSIWFTDENTGWAAGSYDQIGLGQEPQIIHTTDGGLTWQNVFISSNIQTHHTSFLQYQKVLLY
jgi:photosystem II stability/assembly factor-like uncharacterized protein